MKQKRVFLLCVVTALLLPVIGCTGTGSNTKTQAAETGESESKTETATEVRAGKSVPFLTFLSDFVKDCYWGTNFNRLLRDNDAKLAKYLDPKMEIRRYFSPGAVPYLYTREQDFGFDDYADMEGKPNPEGIYNAVEMTDDMSVCELEFGNGNGVPEIYYRVVEGVPDEVYNSETLETRPVTTPYPKAKIMVVYLPEYYKDNVTPRAFYFIETPKGWKLGFVDDSNCSA